MQTVALDKELKGLLRTRPRGDPESEAELAALQAKVTQGYSNVFSADPAFAVRKKCHALCWSCDYAAVELFKAKLDRAARHVVKKLDEASSMPDEEGNMRSSNYDNGGIPLTDIARMCSSWERARAEFAVFLEGREEQYRSIMGCITGLFLQQVGLSLPLPLSSLSASLPLSCLSASASLSRCELTHQQEGAQAIVGDGDGVKAAGAGIGEEGGDPSDLEILQSLVQWCLITLGDLERYRQQYHPRQVLPTVAADALLDAAAAASSDPHHKSASSAGAFPSFSAAKDLYQQARQFYPQVRPHLSLSFSSSASSVCLTQLTSRSTSRRGASRAIRYVSPSLSLSLFLLCVSALLN
jgi:hypothetical protein